MLQSAPPDILFARRSIDSSPTAPDSAIEYTDAMDNQIPASELGRKLAARRRRIRGTCLMCGTTFTGTGKRRYCSDRCRFRATYLRRKEHRKSQREDQP
jgi:hypothetical protein